MGRRRRPDILIGTDSLSDSEAIGKYDILPRCQCNKGGKAGDAKLEFLIAGAFFGWLT